MFYKRNFSVCVLLLLLTLLAGACGGSRSASPLADFPDLSTPAASDGQAAALPALSALPQPQRELSIIGPGFFNLALDELVGSSGVIGDASSVTLNGGGNAAYAMFGLAGFDGDNGPTSARLTSSAVSNEYFVAFSDYVSGKWSIAGPYNGTAEVDIPNNDEYTAADAFTSQLGACYLAILTGPGDSATFTKVELGVHGGDNGPVVPIDFGGRGEALSFYLSWAQSISYHDPDFSGYSLQRAPALAGDYVDLSTEIITENYFKDDTALQDVDYRYRLCAEDASGNRSVWRTILDGPNTGDVPSPLLKLDMPHGPLYGPVAVNFDFSDSTDPAGEGISSYKIEIALGPPGVTSVTPEISMILQPGCYMINAEVECVGPPVRQASNRYKLIVYPQWQASPVVVREPVAPSLFDTRRIKFATGTLNPQAQRLTYCGMDMSNICTTFWSAPADNPAALQMTRLPLYKFPAGAADAFDVDSSTFFMYMVVGELILARFDGSTASQEVVSADPATGKIAAASDGSQAWGFYDNFDGLNTNLVVQPFPDATSWTAVPGTGPLQAIDALYNPATNTVDVVFSAVASTEWVRLDMATQAVVDSANIDGVPADDVDLELDPATGRPILLYGHSLRNRFTALDGFNTWAPAVLVDNAVDNFWPLDLITDDGVRYAYFRTGPAGQAALYKEDAGLWLAVNTVAFAADSALEVCLLPQPGLPDYALVLDMDTSRNFHLGQLHNDGTDTEVWKLHSADGQGYELHAAAGTDGLHAVWRSLGTGMVRHALSLDGGASWNDPGDLGSFLNPDIAADASGDIYFSAYNAGNAELYWWDGAAFNLRQSFANSSAHRPFFSALPESSIEWSAYDHAATTMHYVDVDEPVYNDNPVLMDATPIWEGIANYLGVTRLWFGIVGGANPSSGYVCWSEDGGNDVAPLYEPVLPGITDIFTTPVTGGRTFATTTYYAMGGLIPQQIMYTTRGRLFNPVSYIAPFYDAPEMQEVDLGQDFSLLTLDSLHNVDFRNTAASTVGWSATGVTLLSSADGSRNYFAWSNLGDWQELPLPLGMDHQSMPQLVIGMDGRWHILYTNWATSQLMSISTI